MKPNPGANPTEAPSFARILTQLVQFWRNPQLFGRVLGFYLLVFGSIALDLPGRPLLAEVACTRMERNSQGAAVTALQETLNSNGFNAGTADGIFGENTEIALKLFQRRNSLEPDGVVGPATCAALIKLSNSKFSTITAANPSPTTGSGSTNTTVLKRGDTGAAVTSLQRGLVARGFSNQSINGVFDEETENSVKRLQLLEGLPVTGRVDATTKARLDAYLAANPTPSPAPANPVPAPRPPAPSPTPAPAPAPPRPPATAEGAKYRVVIPLRDGNLLAEVRTYVPSAILDRNRLGQFVSAGSYSNRFDAESLSNTLKARGFDARVVRR